MTSNSAMVYVLMPHHLVILKRNGHANCRYCGVELQVGDRVFRPNRRCGKKYHEACAKKVNLI